MAVAAEGALREIFQHKFNRKHLECLTYMFDKGIACDVTLRVQGREIPCHKVILAAHSSVLHDMFQFDPTLLFIEINDITYDVLTSILRFCYTNDIDIPNEHTLDFLYASKQYDFHEISEICAGTLVEKVNKNNILVYLNVAFEFNCAALKSKCKDLFSAYTQKILKLGFVEDLSYEALRFLMEAEEVTNCREVDLFRACRQWARAECRRHAIPVASGEEIRTVLSEILPLINFQEFELQECKYILQSSVLNTVDERKLYLYMNMPVKVRQVAKLDLEIQAGKATPKRKYHKTESSRVVKHDPKFLLCDGCENYMDTDFGCEWVVCGECLQKFHLNCIEEGKHKEHLVNLQVFLNKEIKHCCCLCGSSLKQSGFSCAVCPVSLCLSCYHSGLHGHHANDLQRVSQGLSKSSAADNIYILHVGGCDTSDQVMSSCDVYDVNGEQLPKETNINIPSMPENRAFAAVVDTDDYIYIIGGHDGTSVQKSCLGFDKKKLCWEQLQDMHHERYGCSAAMLDGKILVVGGAASVEMYDVNDNSWKVVGDYPGGSVMYPACCAWNGRFCVSYDKLVYTYTPATSSWHQLPSLVESHTHHAMVAVSGILYVLGGAGNATIEMYSEQTKQFTIIAKLPCLKCSTNAVVIGKKIILIGGYVSRDSMVTFDTETCTVTEKKMTLYHHCQQSHVALITL